MADNPRPALYGARYSALPVCDPLAASAGPAWLAGPYCESGDVLIEHRINISGDAVIEALSGENIHLRGEKVINGNQRITRTPLLGAL